MESDLIKADCVEATEFPDLAGRYRVYAVPRTVINEEASIEGALPEQFFLDRILQAIFLDRILQAIEPSKEATAQS